MVVLRNEDDDDDDDSTNENQNGKEENSRKDNGNHRRFCYVYKTEHPMKLYRDVINSICSGPSESLMKEIVVLLLICGWWT